MATLGDVARNAYLQIRGRSGPRTPIPLDPPEPSLHPLKTYPNHSGTITSVAFLPDGKLIVTGSLDGTVRVRGMTDGQEVGKVIDHGSAVWAIAVSEDGKRLASGGGTSGVVVWDMESREKVVQGKGIAIDGIRSLSFSPDAKRLAIGSDAKVVRVWDTVTGTTFPIPFIGHSGPVFCVAFSPNGERIASCDEEVIIVWDSQTARYKGLIRLEVSSIAWTPDGEQLVAACADNSIHIFSSSNNSQLAQWKAHTDYIWSIVVSRDGRFIASGSHDTTAKLWDATGSYHQIGPALQHDDPVAFVTFSPDAKYLASSSGPDERAKISLWDVQNIVTPPFAVDEPDSAVKGNGNRKSKDSTEGEQDPSKSEEKAEVRDEAAESDLRENETASVRDFLDRPAVVLPGQDEDPSGIYERFFEATHPEDQASAGPSKLDSSAQKRLFKHLGKTFKRSKKPEGLESKNAARESKDNVVGDTSVGKSDAAQVPVPTPPDNAKGKQKATDAPSPPSSEPLPAEKHAGKRRHDGLKKFNRLVRNHGDERSTEQRSHSVTPPVPLGISSKAAAYPRKSFTAYYGRYKNPVVIARGPPRDMRRKKDGLTVDEYYALKEQRKQEKANTKTVRQQQQQQLLLLLQGQPGPSNLATTPSAQTTSTHVNRPGAPGGYVVEDGSTSGSSSSSSSGFLLTSPLPDWSSLWQSTPPPQKTLEGRDAEISSIAFLPDSTHVVTGSANGAVRVRRVTDGHEEGKVFEHGSAVWAVAVSKDGMLIATGGTDGRVVLWDAGSHEKVVEVKLAVAAPDWVLSLSFSPDSKRIASASPQSSVNVWNAWTGERLAGPFTGHSSWVWCVAFSPATYYGLGERIASCDGGSIRIWDSHFEAAEPRAITITASAYSLVWAPYTGRYGGQLIAGGQRSIQCFDSRTGAQLFEWSAHTALIRSLTISRDGQFLVSGSEDSTVKLWDALSHQQIGPSFRQDDGAPLRAAAISPDAKCIASAGRNIHVRNFTGTLRLQLNQPLEYLSPATHQHDPAHHSQSSVDLSSYAYPPIEDESDEQSELIKEDEARVHQYAEQGEVREEDKQKEVRDEDELKDVSRRTSESSYTRNFLDRPAVAFPEVPGTDFDPFTLLTDTSQQSARSKIYPEDTGNETGHSPQAESRSGKRLINLLKVLGRSKKENICLQSSYTLSSTRLMLIIGKGQAREDTSMLPETVPPPNKDNPHSSKRLDRLRKLLASRSPSDADAGALDADAVAEGRARKDTIIVDTPRWHKWRRKKDKMPLEEWDQKHDAKRDAEVRRLNTVQMPQPQPQASGSGLAPGSASGPPAPPRSSNPSEAESLNSSSDTDSDTSSISSRDSFEVYYENCCTACCHWLCFKSIPQRPRPSSRYTGA
ncbi:hypothetical protein HYDPIDRAFT_26261 [Hydnomerulius pinastri MD-312]|nr:hypothetical protein HYDPIDRAFT_26261 [Hydnomerulius pinastri MD-312]